MIQRLTEHVYCYPCEYYSDRPNIGYIVGERGALLFEAGNSAKHAELIRTQLKELGLPWPTLVAVSHWHWDHTFALGAWSCPTIAGKQTNDKLRELTGWEWTEAAMLHREESGEDIRFCNDMVKREYPDLGDIKVCPADMEFTDRLNIDLGGVTCELFHVGGPHSEDSVACYVKEDAFLFLGDSNGKDLYGLPWKFDIEHEDELVPTLASLPYDPEKLRPYVALLEKIPFTRCIGGHAEAMTREELMDSLKI